MNKLITAVSLLLVSFIPQANADHCEPSTPMFEGTHFKPIAEENTKLGKELLVKGKILSAADCEPIAGAKVEHWQAGREGYYKDALRAYSYSNDSGEYSFETEWPELEPPHIHFTVSADGYKSITTQWTGEAKVDSVVFDIVLQKKQSSANERE